MNQQVSYSKTKAQPTFTLIQLVNVRHILIAMILVSIFILSHYLFQ